MSLPAGVYVGLPVQYLPNVFDATAWNNEQGPVAAIITAIDTVNNTIDLTVFPSGKAPLFRSGIQYYSDAGDDQNGFKLSTDVLTCTAEVTGIAVTDTSSENFTVEFTQPTGSHGFLSFYRVTGSGTWLTPNQPGNATVAQEDGVAIFAGLTDATSYDILIQNICNNGIASAGVTVTDTAILPP